MAFNVLDYVQGSLYPSREADVYLDGNALSRLQRLNEDLKKETSKTRQAEIKKEIKAHKADLEKSRLTFHVQGFAPHVRQSITEAVRTEAEEKGWDDEKSDAEVMNRIFAAAIQKVVNANGEFDEHKWTPEEIATLMNTAPNGALKDLISAVVHVTTETLKFDQGVDVPF